MAWVNSVGKDISHHNSIPNYASARTFTDWVQIKVSESTGFIDPAASRHHNGFSGVSRGPYHFARPVSLIAQIAHFLHQKRAVGVWERPDMLDCEFEGVTGAFIKALVQEYRRQSGVDRLLVYVGLHDLLNACRPSLWWDSDLWMWAARYRKIGQPLGPDAWVGHLGFDHPGLSTYQWDNATPFYPGGPVGDTNVERVAVGASRPSPPQPTPIEEVIRTMQDREIFYAKGDVEKAVYAVQVTFSNPQRPLMRRYVSWTEWEIVRQAGGEKMAVFAQDQFDAIPKVEGSQ